MDPHAMNDNGFPDSIAHLPNHAPQAELADRIARLATDDGVHATAIPSLFLMRFSEPRPCSAVLYEPRLCIVAQGRKIAILAGETYHYDPLHYLVVSMTLPALGQIIEATPEHPYLSLRLDIDMEQLGALMLETPATRAAEPVDRGLYSARASGALLDAVLRLMRLLEEPEDVSALAPLIQREIYYRALTGDLGHRLRELVTAGSRSHRIARAVQALRDRFHEPLSIDAMAESLHMSVSSLHHQFKAATSMSPLQFQKHLRLHEARRLMLGEGLEANAAARRVGYESASQFSREYKRLFGAPPRSEIVQLRAQPPSRQQDA
ncbi:AraC family transcriptional regulator [Pseudoxanthomonas sp. Root630]|uniref:AraC family transcriptional regulator n=1 Tax=Pseudoxanthomonas sp. Root630 TaxID=1736574 RepID=UPI001F3B4C27|nr:AraC family transcriptional regulator [Pseudoxanthomonas sp. Root630]